MKFFFFSEESTSLSYLFPFHLLSSIFLYFLRITLHRNLPKWSLLFPLHLFPCIFSRFICYSFSYICLALFLHLFFPYLSCLSLFLLQIAFLSPALISPPLLSSALISPPLYLFFTSISLLSLSLSSISCTCLLSEALFMHYSIPKILYLLMYLSYYYLFYYISILF